MVFNILSFRSALSHAGNNDERFFWHTTHTKTGREEFGKDMTTFWKRIVDDPDALPPELWNLLAAV